MNKKAIFLPLFVIATLVILTTMAFTISQVKIFRQDDKVGVRAVSLLKTYDEAENDLLYLEQSLKFSKDSVLDELYANGGYLKINNCNKIVGDDGFYTLFDSSCGEFSVNDNFFNGLSSEFSIYTNNFKSNYNDFKLDIASTEWFLFWSPGVPKIVESERGSIFNRVSTEAVKNIKISDMTNKNNILSIVLSDINFKVENSLQSTYTVHPKFEFNDVDINFFNKVYKLVAVSCKNKEASDCILKLKERYDVIASSSGDVVKVKVLNNGRIFRFAVNVKSSFPKIDIVNILENNNKVCANKDLLLSSKQDSSMSFMDGLKIFIPGEAACGGTYPVIIQLHGLNKNEFNVFLGSGGRDMENIVKQNIIRGGYPVILVEPVNFKESSADLWTVNFDYSVLRDITEKKLREHNINIEHVSIIAHSGAGCDLRNGVYKVLRSERNLHLVGLEDTCYSEAYAKEIIRNLPQSTFFISVHNGEKWQGSPRDFGSFEEALSINTNKEICDSNKYNYCKKNSDGNRLMFYAKNVDHYSIPNILLSETLSEEYALFRQPHSVV